MPHIVPTDHPRYFSDGSGRDSYIHLDNGGLRPNPVHPSLSLRPVQQQLNHITPIHGNHRVGSTTSLPKMKQAKKEQAKRQRLVSTHLSTPRQSHATQESLSQAYPYQAIPVTLPQSVLAKTIPKEEEHYHAQYAHTARPHHIIEAKTSPRKLSQTCVANASPSATANAIIYDGKTMSTVPMYAVAN